MFLSALISSRPEPQPSWQYSAQTLHQNTSGLLSPARFHTAFYRTCRSPTISFHALHNYKSYIPLESGTLSPHRHYSHCTSRHSNSRHYSLYRRHSSDSYNNSSSFAYNMYRKRAYRKAVKFQIKHTIPGIACLVYLRHPAPHTVSPPPCSLSDIS